MKYIFQLKCLLYNKKGGRNEKMEEGDNTFMRITNQDIWNEIKVLSKHVQTTNGKVLLNTEKNKTNNILNKINLTFIIIIIGTILGAKLI